MNDLARARKEVHWLTRFIPQVAEQDDLVADIAHSGLREPVVLYHNKIIEGRVRYAAALEFGMQPQFKDWVLLTQAKDSQEHDVLDWMVRRHVETHSPVELDRIRLVATLLPYYQDAPGQTYIRLNKATGLSHHKVRNVQWLLDAGKLEPVLTGEQEILEAGRAIGVVSEKRSIALGKGYGMGDKFDEATQPLKRYLAGWKRKGYEFRHVNPKEGQRRLLLIDQLIAELQAAKVDLERRAVVATLSAPPERKRKS